MTGSVLAVCLLLALGPFLAGCGPDSGSGTPNTTDYRLRGRVLDAETGKELSRETLYLHFFCDEAKLKKTLNPEAGSDYEVLMPKAKVRVRVSDKERVYALFEQTLDLASKNETFDIRLKPTNYIQLHGKLLDASGKPLVLPEPDGGVGNSIMLYFSHDGMPFAGPFGPERDGTYSLRVPRGVVTVSAVNFPGKIKNDTIDLTGKTTDSSEFDIQFE